MAFHGHARMGTLAYTAVGRRALPDTWMHPPPAVRHGAHAEHGEIGDPPDLGAAPNDRLLIQERT